MVMPRSRSMALLSITVSTTFSCSAKVPLWRSSWSTMVVLPWSTWAMMAMLRICLLIRHFLKIWVLAVCSDGAQETFDFLRAQQTVGDQFTGLDMGTAQKGLRFRPVDPHLRCIGSGNAAPQTGEKAGRLFAVQ